MYCKNCGEKIDDKAVICPHCGCQQKPMETDSGNIGWAFLGFFFPIVGLILFLVWHDTKPKTAIVSGKGALASVIVQIAGAVISAVISAIAGISLLGFLFAFI